jgi:hypothetical protein
VTLLADIAGDRIVDAKLLAAKSGVVAELARTWPGRRAPIETRGQRRADKIAC